MEYSVQLYISIFIWSENVKKWKLFSDAQVFVIIRAYMFLQSSTWTQL